MILDMCSYSVTCVWYNKYCSQTSRGEIYGDFSTAGCIAIRNCKNGEVKYCSHLIVRPPWEPWHMGAVWRMESVRRRRSQAYHCTTWISCRQVCRANPLGLWASLLGWLRECRDLLAFLCILFFIFRFFADFCTVVATAVEAGLTVAIAVCITVSSSMIQLHIDSCIGHQTAYRRSGKI